jgi:multicomponent Na+:H+ antiporter subunit E
MVSRAACFLALWIVLMPSAKPVDLLLGALATTLATWASLRLLEPSAGHLRFGALLALAPHFLWQSVLAGLDVARRAFDPRMPLAPGFVEYPVELPSGLTRNTFAAITSLLPGSVPCGETRDTLVYHCLDRRLPNVEQLKREERLFARALVPPTPAREDGHD